MKRILITVSMVAVIWGVFLTGCGSSSDYASSEAMSYESAVETNYDTKAELGMAMEDAAYEEEYDMAPEEQAELGSVDRKLVRNVNLSVETEGFDALLVSLEGKVSELGGYIEQMNINNGSSYYRTGSYRNASITARIPADKLDSFLESVALNSNITYRGEHVQDVTLQYVDVQSHLEALRAQQTRLLELVEQAETVEELVFLEGELTDVRYQIQSLESSLRTMNNQVSYATVEMDIEEVTTYTPVVEVKKTAGQRIKEGFVHSCQSLGEGISEFFISFVIILPYLVLWGVILFLVIFVIRKCSKRHKKRVQAMYQQPYVPTVLKVPNQMNQPQPQPQDQREENHDTGNM